MIDASTRLLIAITVMGLFVAAILVADERRMRAHESAATTFQRLVGGLGLGPDTNWSTCPHEFDPRVSADCVYTATVLPGGTNTCPYRTASIMPLAAVPPAPLTGPNEHAATP